MVFLFSSHFVVAMAMLSAIVYMTPSVLNPTIWTEPSPLRTLTGPLAPNNILGNAIGLHEGLVLAPESIAFHPITGVAFAGLGDGRVVRMSQSGEHVENLLFIGGIVNSKHSNVGDLLGNGLDHIEAMQYCYEEYVSHRLSWNETDESRCGRPLGMRIKQKPNSSEGEYILYFVDAYHGLFSLDLQSLAVTHLVSPTSSFEECAVATDAIGASDSGGNNNHIDTLVSVRPKFFNDLDVSDDGNVYFTDSSYLHPRAHNREELLDGAPRGRLLQFNLQTSQLKTLICGLHFPNGVQIYSQPLPTILKKNQKVNDEQELEEEYDSEAIFRTEFPSTKLLVVEAARFRVLLIDLGASEFSPSFHGNPSEADPRVYSLLTSCSEYGSLYKAINFPQVPSRPAIKIFLDSAPGFFDNIRKDEFRAGNNDQQFLVGVGTLSVKPFSLLWFGYQYQLLRDLIGKLVPMKLVEHLVPKYGLVVVLDSSGNIVQSLHDPTGKHVNLVSEANRNPITGDLWFGSHSVKQVSIVRNQYLVGAI